MTPKNRNAMLILVCALLIFALPMLQPDVVVPPFAWDWRTSPGTGPIEDAPSHDPTAIRVLAAPDAPWVQELLRSVGVIGVHTGAPSSANPDEVWILTGAGCAHAEAATAHAQAGGALLVLARCDGLLAALEVPPPLPWSQPAAVASAARAGTGSVGALALADDGFEWPLQESGADLLVRRMTGGELLHQKGPVAVLSFDLPAHIEALRQGDPSLAGIDFDGDGTTRAVDLRPFPWSSPTWRLPSADVWAEVLAAAIDVTSGRAHPRLWPVPEGQPSAVALTIEQNGADDETLRTLFDTLESADVEATLLLDGPLKATLLQELADSGHGLGIQPHGTGLGSPREVEAVVREALARARGQSDPIRAIRNRDGLWWGYDPPARLASSLDLDVLLDFVSVGPGFSGPGFAFGGSRPLRYRAADGTLLPVLQLPTVVWDRALVGEAAWSQHLDDLDRLTLATERILDVAMAWRIPLVVSVEASAAPEILDAFLAAASDRALPVLSAERLATFAWDLRAAVASPVRAGASPMQTWTPGTDCPTPVAASPLSQTGCLRPVAVETSPAR